MYTALYWRSHHLIHQVRHTEGWYGFLHELVSKEDRTIDWVSEESYTQSTCLHPEVSVRRETHALHLRTVAFKPFIWGLGRTRKGARTVGFTQSRVPGKDVCTVWSPLSEGLE